MAIQSCVGDDRKRKISRLYVLQVGLRAKILPHQRQPGLREECCHRALEDEFYQFYYAPRFGSGDDRYDDRYPHEAGSFFVGTHCGRKLIEIIRETTPDFADPPLFNPLRGKPRPRGDGSGGGKSGDHGEHIREKPSRLNAEVMTVIQLIGSLSPQALAADLAETLGWLRDHPDQDTKDQFVFALNEAVGAHPEIAGGSLRALMDRQGGERGYAWRGYAFDTIERLLADEGRTSHIDPGADLSAEPPVRHQVTVIELGDRLNRVEIEDGTLAVLFPDCPGLGDITDAPLAVGDLLTVRLASHPKGLRVSRVHGRAERGIAGTIRYVGPQGNYAFVRPDDGTPDIFVPQDLYHTIDAPRIGTAVVVRARETPRKPMATWARQLIEP